MKTHRFRPLVDLYRKAGAEAGFTPNELSIGIHSLGYVAETKDEAVSNYFPGYAKKLYPYRQRIEDGHRLQNKGLTHKIVQKELY